MIPSGKKIGQNLNSTSVASNINDVSSIQNRENMLRHSEKLWELMDEYIGHDKTSIQKQIVTHIEYTLAKSRFDFNI